MKKLTRILAIVLCLTLVVSFAACSKGGGGTQASPSATAGTSGPTTGGVLKIGLNTQVTSLGFPAADQPSGCYSAYTPAVETLARYDENCALTPWLATAWEEDAEACTLTVHLREGVKFSDGSEFNAEAVKFNWEQWPANGRNELVYDSIEVKDNYTVVIHLPSWNNAIAETALYTAGWMISKEYCEANGKAACESNPVGTGPFKLKEWKQAVSITYEKNPNYWIAGQPYLDGVEMVLITESATMTSAFLTGEVDMVWGSSADTVSDLVDKGYKTISKPLKNGISITIMTFNSLDETQPTSNLKVRQAICHAIDRDALVGLYAPANCQATDQWCAPGSWAYNEDTVGYPYDIEKAKALLTEAGYPNGFELNMVITNGNQLYVTAIQDMLDKINVKVNIDLIDQAVSNERSGKGGTWQGAFYSAGKCDPDIAPIYARTFTEDGVRYVGGVAKPAELVQLIADTRAAKDTATKEELSKKLSKMLIDDYCLVYPVATNSGSSFANDKVHDSNIDQYHFILWTPETAWKAA